MRSWNRHNLAAATTRKASLESQLVDTSGHSGPGMLVFLKIPAELGFVRLAAFAALDGVDEILRHSALCRGETLDLVSW